MKNILYTIALAFALICCSTNKSLVDQEMNFGAQMINAYERVYTMQQFDSICYVDKISNNLDKKWHQMGAVDAETGQRFVEYLYIKSYQNNQIIYRAIRINSNTIKITKRITK